MKKKIIETLKHWLGIGFIRDGIMVHEVQLNRLSNEFHNAITTAKNNRGLARLEAVEKFVAGAVERRQQYEEARRKRIEAANLRSDRIVSLERANREKDLEIARLKESQVAFHDVNNVHARNFQLLCEHLGVTLKTIPATSSRVAITKLKKIKW